MLTPEYALVCYCCQHVLELGSSITPIAKPKQLQLVSPERLRKLIPQAGSFQRTLLRWLGEHAFHNVYLWHSGLVDYEEPWVLITEDDDCLVTPGWTVADLSCHGDTPEDLLPSPNKLHLVS